MTEGEENAIITIVQDIEQKKKGGKNVAFDYSKLRGKISEVFITQSRFAIAMEWSERTLSLKMNGTRPWKQPDICKAINLLGLSDEDIPAYFFDSKVQDIEPNKEDKQNARVTDF